MIDAVRQIFGGAIQRIDRYPGGYEPSAQTFPPLDRESLAFDLDLERRARDAARGRCVGADGLDEVEREILSLVEAKRKDAYDVYTERLSLYAEREARLGGDGVRVAVEIEAKDAVADFRVEADRALGRMHARGNAVREHQRELREFRRAHGLRRPGRRPESRLLNWGILLMLAVAEIVFNTYFFGEGSEFGLVGGLIAGLAVTAGNIGVCFVLGRLVVPFVGHRRIGHRLWAWPAAALLAGLVVGFHLVVGHFRDITNTVSPEEAGALAWPAFLAAPAGFSDFYAWMLFCVGLVAAVVATVDAFRMDDPYPGYGDVTARFDRAQRNFMKARGKIVDDLTRRKNEVVDGLRGKLDDCAHRRETRGEIAGGRARLTRQFREHLDHLEGALQALILAYRGALGRSPGALVPVDPAGFPPVALVRPPSDDGAERQGPEDGEADAMDALRRAVDGVAAAFEAAYGQFDQLKATLGKETAHAADA
ncbi:MAG: hypothetical protein KDG89_03665 [Geminicoccaceae bacterium]|nr:hypothetical protein [Geminicoccaceae bacterium]